MQNLPLDFIAGERLRLGDILFRNTVNQKHLEFANKHRFKMNVHFKNSQPQEFSESLTLFSESSLSASAFPNLLESRWFCCCSPDTSLWTRRTSSRSSLSRCVSRLCKSSSSRTECKKKKLTLFPMGGEGNIAPPPYDILPDNSKLAGAEGPGFWDFYFNLVLHVS